MTDQTTYLSPNLHLGEDEYGDHCIFWVAGDSLAEVVECAADLIGMYLTGRDGYPLFNGIIDLDAVK